MLWPKLQSHPRCTQCTINTKNGPAHKLQNCTTASTLSTGSCDADDEQEVEAPDASHIAQQAEHALHCPGSTVRPDPVTSAPASQKSSRRTTTDGVLDRLLHEVDASMLPRQDSAAQATNAQPSVTGRRSTADTMLPANQNNDTTGPQLAASNPMQSSSSNSRRSSASGTAAGVLPLHSHVDHPQAASGYRSTADSVLASVLDEVEHEVEGKANHSVDKLLDDVLVEVAGAASRQRTTADSVLDAMLDDMSSSQLEVISDIRRQPSGQYSVQAGLQAVSHLPCVDCACTWAWQSGCRMQHLG